MEISVEGLEFRLVCGEYQVTGGFDVKYQSDDTDAPAWARLSLSDDLEKFLKANPADNYILEIGNENGYELLVSGAGTSPADGILILTEENDTHAENISVFFLCATLQEAARYLFAVFGISGYVITDTDYGRRQNYRIDASTYQEALRQLNAVYQADILFYRQNGIIYYGVQPEQDTYYLLSDDNILDIIKNGDIWNADIIPVPGIRPRQALQFDCLEYRGIATVISCTLEGDENGIDMRIKFRGLDDG